MVRVYRSYRNQRDRDEDRWITGIIGEAKAEQENNPMSTEYTLEETDRLSRSGAGQAKELGIKPRDIDRTVHDLAFSSNSRLLTATASRASGLLVEIREISPGTSRITLCPATSLASSGPAPATSAIDPSRMASNPLSPDSFQTPLCLTENSVVEWAMRESPLFNGIPGSNFQR